MKGIRFWFVATLSLFVFYTPCIAQKPEPLRPEWLAEDYKSIELVSLLASPAPLTTQRIRDILGVEDDGEEKDLGFDASIFDIGKGHGYTTLYVEGFVFRGTIGFYKLGIRASPEIWPQIREHVIDLWKHNHGPEFTESESGLEHTKTNDDVWLRYKSSVSSQLGEMKRAEVSDELKKAFDYLTSPIANTAIGDPDGEIAIDGLIQAKRVDLIENVLRGFNPSGRVYAALALLQLSRDNQLVLSPDTIGTIAKIRNLNISIMRVRGCLISYQTAAEILSEPDESDLSKETLPSSEAFRLHLTQSYLFRPEPGKSEDSPCALLLPQLCLRVDANFRAYANEDFL
ncbi:MAG TPA: hypothetical protein VJM12_21180 [Pyrinomonadaceae bacterium]|nr:hypothetical protein [Pyrinomonadaceae bacterium]